MTYETKRSHPLFSGSQWEAILKLGARLQQWSKDPPVSAAVASLFKLAPGQEQAFANAIMMHLTDTFVSGTNLTRFCILKILFQGMKSRKKRHTNKLWERGMFTKERFPNYMEVLKRIKSVARAGDHFARALAFWVFGCLAELASDSIEIYMLILKALHSPYDHEVQAAVFALSCLCSISENFAVLAVGQIHDMIIAKETTPNTKIQAISVFAQMSSSIVSALKAHETGKTLMVSMSVEELLATIEALSKLALECSILVAAQVELLLSYVKSDPRMVVRAFSLKCLLKLAKRATGMLGIEGTAFEIFASMYECADELPYMRELALKALRKLFPFCVLVSDAGSLMRLLSSMKSKASTSIWSEGQPVLGFLVYVVCTLKKVRPDLLKIADAQLGPGPRASAAVSEKHEEPIYGSEFSTSAVLLVCNQIVRLGCEWSIEGFTNMSAVDFSTEGHALGGTELRRRCLFLGGLLVQLAQYSPHCGFVVIDSLSRLVETLLKTTPQQAEEGEAHQKVGHRVMAETHNERMANLDADSAARSCVLKLLCRCIKDCGLFWLSQEGPSSTAFVRMTKLVAWITSASIHHHNLVDSFVLITKVGKYMSSEEAKAVAHKVNLTVATFIQKKEFWSAYKAVAAAACSCLWNNSPSTFEQLMHKAQSQSTFYWLKAFVALCTFEETLQSECSLKVVQCSMDVLESKVSMHSCTSANLGQAIARALSSAYAAESSLAAAGKSVRMFEFQRGLLSLRVAFIRTSGELLGLLSPICAQIKAIDLDALASSTLPTKNDSVKRLISSIQVIAGKSATLCTQFKKLAVAFDGLRVSTMGIDKGSANILSFASLGCSFFSFCVLCSLFIPQLLSSGSDMNPPMQLLAAYVSNDLYLRLCTSSGHECTELHNFVIELGGANGSPIISKGDFWSYDAKEARKFIICSVQKLLLLHERTSIRNPELSWEVLARGVHLCRNLVEKWLNLPWALPKRFLNTRPPVGMDIFVELMTDASSGKERQIAQGNLAPLSMCFHIRNLQINGNAEVSRLCCALLLKSHKPEWEELQSSWNLGWYGEKTVCNENDLHLLDRLIKKVSIFNNMMWEDFDEHANNGRANRDFPPIVQCDVNEKGQAEAIPRVAVVNRHWSAVCVYLAIPEAEVSAAA
ncbi:hypothetical protein GOP47_0025528 [Adiantum capillus-veneris]|uniref:ARM repeat superfamily protein n=1 Tax=Adiantum capillus-veneris TaxID=13818 RepID=A0A9D4U0I6_ADICA|nr:hypothetical protein GOP47_0025528 [Adiantum capillus-veneris]